MFTEPALVLADVDSAREPVLAQVGEVLDYDLALAGLADRVRAAIAADGRFRAVNRGGVFVCR